jgi:hypothetical protein
MSQRGVAVGFWCFVGDDLSLVSEKIYSGLLFDLDIVHIRKSLVSPGHSTIIGSSPLLSSFAHFDADISILVHPYMTSISCLLVAHYSQAS